MLTFLIFLAVLAVLVLSHEFGHFIVARKSGMKVYEFGFGFPPRVFGIQSVKNANGQKKWRLIWGKGAGSVIPTESADEWRNPLHSEAKGSLDGSTSLTTGLARDDNSTIYSFNLIPLGGFVNIKGEDGQESGADSFATQKAWKRALTLFAGVGMNIILAFVLLSVGFMIGQPQATDNLPTGAQVKNSHLEIIEAMSGKPAAQA